MRRPRMGQARWLRQRRVRRLALLAFLAVASVLAWSCPQEWGLLPWRAGIAATVTDQRSGMAGSGTQGTLVPEFQALADGVHQVSTPSGNS